MPPSRVVALLCALGLGAGSLSARTPGQPAAPPPAAPQPRLVVLEPIFDFGDSPPGEALRHDFEIRNDGDAELRVDNVVAGCACTTATSDRTLAPGASGRLHVVLETADLAGAVAKQIALYTNDPDAPKSLLTLRATVLPHLVLRPESLRLDGVRLDPPRTVGATLWATDRDDLEVRSIDSDEPALKLAFRPATGAERDRAGRGRQWRLEATLDPAAPLGAIAVVAHVHTNHPQDAVLAVPVFGAQHDPLELVPNRAALGTVHAGPAFSRVLRLRNLGVEPVAVTAVTSTVPALSAVVTALPDGRTFEIELRLDAGMPPGDFAGTLVIETSSPRRPRLEVPVTGTAR